MVRSAATKLIFEQHKLTERLGAEKRVLLGGMKLKQDKACMYHPSEDKTRVLG
jgi:hypothetical protein